MQKLVIWDLDGTLVDSLPSTFAAFNDGIEPVLGKRLEPAEIAAHFGAAERKIIAKLVGEEHADACYQRMVAAIESRLTEVRVFDGIVDTLEALASGGFRHAIFTGRGRRTTDVILKHTGLGRHFELVVAGDEVARHKPHPEGIHKICRALRVAEAEAVMIGDHHYDVAAGHSAGTRTIACTWSLIVPRETLEAARPAHFVAAPHEVGDLLRARA